MTPERIDIRTLWNAAEPGTVLPRHDDWPCGTASPGMVWVCLRATRHTGQHVAAVIDGDVLLAVAVWDPAAADHPLPSLDTLLRQRDAGRRLKERLRAVNGGRRP